MRLVCAGTYKSKFANCNRDENIGPLHGEHLSERFSWIDHGLHDLRRQLVEQLVQPMFDTGRPFHWDSFEPSGETAMVEENLGKNAEHS